MRSQWDAVIRLVALVTLVHASDNSVHIYNTYPDLRITSSTLRWIGDQNGNRPDSAVIATVEIVPAELEDSNAAKMDEGAVDAVKEQPVHVCRARHNGLWVPGQLRTGFKDCQVSLLGRVFNYPQYEVLENVDTGARLSWVQWGRYSPVLQKGAVAGGDSYVARRRVDTDLPQDETKILGLRHYVGRFEPKEGIGRIIVIQSNAKESEEREYHEGEILVETEPISYEVNGLKFLNKRRKEVRTIRELGSATLRNEQLEGSIKVDTVIAYDAVLSIYWGQGRAMLKGLPTNIRMPNGLMEEIKWGIPFIEERKDVHRVEAMLKPGTAVNVTVWGNHTESEVPYSGKLVAIYEDLQTRARSISGVQIEKSMKDLKAVFGHIYWINNDTLVPTTTTSTTTTTTSTTLRPKENSDDTTVQRDDAKVQEAILYQKNVSLAPANPVPSGCPSLFHVKEALLLLLSILLRIT